MSISVIKQSPLCPDSGAFEAEVKPGVWEDLRVNGSEFEIQRYGSGTRKVSAPEAARWFLQHGVPQALAKAIQREVVTDAIVDLETQPRRTR